MKIEMQIKVVFDPDKMENQRDRENTLEAIEDEGFVEDSIEFEVMELLHATYVHVEKQQIIRDA